MACVIDNIYYLNQSIGKGNFGEVFITTKIGDQQNLYATKKMDRRICEQPQFFNRLSNEVNIIMRVNHQNIVKFIDIKRTQHNWYLITEYYNGGSLASNLKKYLSIYHKPFPENLIQYLMKQIVDAVNYLHFNKIIHRDLKLDNILVHFPNDYDRQTFNLMNCQIKIIDFGFATVLNSELTFTALGTPHNMDPKILEHINTGVKNSGYNEKVDIWSLGTLCYEMAVGHSPFQGACMQELFQKVQQGNYTLPASLSEEIVSFINDMLQQNEDKRAEASQLKKHPFLNNPVSSFHAIDVNKIQANYIPGGMINMKSKQPKANYNNNYNIWTFFNQPELYKGAISTNQMPVYNQNQIKSKSENIIHPTGIQSEYGVPNQQNYYYYISPNSY